MSKPSILIVDDSNYAEMLEDVLDGMGYSSESVENGKLALEAYENGSFDLCLVDIHMQHMDGLAYLKKLKAAHPQAMVVMMTGFPTLKLAIGAFKNGAFDFLEKPVDFRLLKEVIQRALETRHAPQSHAEAHYELLQRSISRGKTDKSSDIVVGESQKIKDLKKNIEKALKTDGIVLIEGEAGTLKKSIAEYLHHNGKKSEGPLIGLDVTQTSEQVLWDKLIGNEDDGGSGFTDASGGSFVLRNIHALPLEIQARLNELLRNKAKNKLNFCKLICTCAHDLDVLIERDEFHEELGFRLTATSPIKIPSIRDNLEDLPLMVSHYTKGTTNPFFDTAEMTFSNDAMAVMAEYAWPGNHIEFIEVITSVVSSSRSRTIEYTQLPYHISPLNEWPSIHVVVAREVVKYVKALLRATGNDRDKVAELFHVSREDLEHMEAGDQDAISILSKTNTPFSE